MKSKTTTFMPLTIALVFLANACSAETEVADVRTDTDESTTLELNTGKTGQIFWKTHSCANGDENAISVILTAAIPKLIDLGIDLFSERLETISDEYQVTHVGQSAELWGDFRQQGSNQAFVPKKSCLVFASGDSGPWGVEKSRHQEAMTIEEDKKRYDESIRSRLSRPSIYFTADVVVANVVGGVSFFVRPHRFILSGKTSRGSSAKDFVATIRFDIPKTVTGESFTSEAVLPPMSGINIGDRIEFSGYSSSWLPFPSFEIEDGVPLSGSLPVTLHVSVVESDPGFGAKIFRTFSDVLEEKKQEISEQLVGSKTQNIDDNS